VWGFYLEVFLGRYKLVTLWYYILVSLFQVEEFDTVFQYLTYRTDLTG